MKLDGILNSRGLTRELQRMAAESQGSVDDEGRTVTREQALAAMIWKYALGWTESRTDSKGITTSVEQPPAAWAMQYVFERLEGKPAAAKTEEADGRITAAEKVRGLARERLNAMAGKPKSVVPPPPAFKPQHAGV